MSKKKSVNYLQNATANQLREIGRLVAEEDMHLTEYYVGRERFVDRAMSFEDPAVFFVGPKGAGKSAILQMTRLLRSDDIQRVINISPDDLAFSALANVEASTPLLANACKNEWVFKTLWDYVLSLEVLKREYHGSAALLTKLTGLFSGRSAADARRLVQLSLSDDGTAHTLSERILQLVKEVELSANVKGVTVSGSIHVEHPERREHLSLLSTVNSVARNLPSLLKHPYHVLIDDLDRYWNDTPVQNAFLAALFESLRKLNGKQLKFVVALRERIYRCLPLDDKDKLRDWVVRVDWEMQDVAEMITRRVSRALDCTFDEVWENVFPQTAQKTLWERTAGKPREMIRLASICLEIAKQHGHRVVEDGDVGRAVSSFSKEKIEDIGSELSYRYRGFDKVVRKMISWPKEFPLEKIHELAIALGYEFERTGKDTPEYQWAAVYGDDAMGLAQIFLETGILRLKQNRTATAVEFDPDNQVEITAESWFSVHPMYTAGLECVGEALSR